MLHGYSDFPGLRQAVEVTSRVKELRRGEVVKETTTVAYAATSLSPRDAGAGLLEALLRRHWMAEGQAPSVVRPALTGVAENRHHYVRDNHWREDRATWRTGHAAFVMFVLLSISLNPLRASSPLWRDETPMTLRSMAAEHAITVAPETLVHTPP